MAGPSVEGQVACAGVAGMVGGGVALSPAQRELVEKARAVQRAKSEKDAIKAAIEEASRRRVDETRQRCRAQQEARDAQAKDRKLIIRHVGEELARMALKSDLGSNSKRPVKQSGLMRASLASNNGGDGAASGPDPNAVDDDGYDEERFGPVRRPPRPRKANLWLQVFEKEKEDVEQEQEERKRRRLAAAAEFRQQLALQEAGKQLQRKSEKQRDDEYAHLQAKQNEDWKAQEKEKLERRQRLAEEEARKCKEQVQFAMEQQALARKKREVQELKTLARYQAMTEEEKRQKELRKRREKEEVACVAEANAMQLALKHKEKLREQEEEVRLQREYEKKLEMQEAARQRELQEVLARQSQKVKMALLNVKSAEEKAREDEERAAIVQAQVRQREELERLKREQKKREVIRTQTLALQEQKREKLVRVHEQARDEEAYAAQFKQDYLEWLAAQKLKQAQTRQRSLAHESLVVRQMREDAARRADEDKYGMSKREMALNAALLRSIGLERPPSDAAPR